MRLADYVFEFLADRGVREVFTVTGGGSIFLCDALGLNPRLRYYCCHHEQAVTMAAEAYARVTGTIGVGLVTLGPGATNALTGVAGAWLDSVPQLTISGQAFLSQTVGSSGLRQIGVQEFPVMQAVRSMTKYAVTVEDPAEIRCHLERALFLAHRGRPGPVWIEIPADIQNKQIDPGALSPFTPVDEAPQYDADLSDRVARVVELLTTSERPLLHIGQGVRLAAAAGEFAELAQRLQIPFVTARNANDIYASAHPLLIGRPGIFGQRAANFAVQCADWYAAVGTRLSLPQTGFNTKDYARKAVKIMVDVDGAELRKPSLPIDLPIHHDAGAFLRELLRQTAALQPRPQWKRWLACCRSWRERYPVVLPAYRTQRQYVNSYYFTELLARQLTPEDIIVTDMGISFQGTHQAFEVKQGQRFFTNCGCAAMGWGLPASIGACLAAGRRRVVCISGEGGLQMNIQELATVMLHALPVKLFVLNNGGYLTIKQTQELGLEGRLMGSTCGSGLGFPDLLTLAAAYRIPARRAASHDGLESIINDVLDGPNPALCEIVMDPNQEQAPKVVNRRSARGSMEQTALEDMYPYLPPDELAAIMDIGEGK